MKTIFFLTGDKKKSGAAQGKSGAAQTKSGPAQTKSGPAPSKPSTEATKKPKTGPSKAKAVLSNSAAPLPLTKKNVFSESAEKNKGNAAQVKNGNGKCCTF